MIPVAVEPAPTLCRDCREPIDLAVTVVLFCRGGELVAACVPCAHRRTVAERRV